MNWTETPSSSNISAFGYDEASGTLAVKFKAGGTYQYFGVPAEVYAALKAAPSKGSFLQQAVKGKYRHQRT